MKRRFIYLLLFLFLLIIALFLFPYEIKQDTNIETYYLSQDGKSFDFFNQKGDLVFSYTINDFKNWAKNNWQDIFDETPSFGDIREVEIDNFNNFSESFALSNNKDYLAFVVSDYAVLVDISFIAFINLNNREISIIADEKIGSVANIKWSSDDNYLAYLLNTARIQGDYLGLDNFINKKELITIKDEDIIYYLNMENIDNNLISFSDLAWIDNNSLMFSSKLLNDDLKFNWQFKVNDNNLELINNN